MKIAGIVGLGLLGGSLAKALKTKANFDKIIAFNRNTKSTEQAFKDGIVDIIAYDIDESFANCDIVFVCTPVSIIVPIIDKLSRIVSSNCILTDVGSTKYSIVKQCKNQYPNFIGAHPMTGSEKTGYFVSDDLLFENTFFIITPTEFNNQSMISDYKCLIENIGAIPVIINAEKHDHIVAAISHLPHLVASALVNTVLSSDDESKSMHLLAAGGFKDTTRIASGDPTMWQNICMENSEEILSLIELFKNQLLLFQEEIKNNQADNIFNLLDSAKVFRDSFSSIRSNHTLKQHQLFVDIIDKPGSIATIATLLSVNNINIKNIGINNNREDEEGVLHIILDNEQAVEMGRELLVEMNYKVYLK